MMVRAWVCVHVEHKEFYLETGKAKWNNEWRSKFPIPTLHYYYFLLLSFSGGVEYLVK